MKERIKEEYRAIRKTSYFWIFVLLLAVTFLVFFIAPVTVGKVSYQKGDLLEDKSSVLKYIGGVLGEEEAVVETLDKEDYDRRMKVLANNPPQPAPKLTKVKNEDGTITEKLVEAPPRVDPWPVKTVYPNPGALLPFNRIIAYYGNLYSKKMGALGEYEEGVMLAKLKAEVDKWQKADPDTKTIPALHYIAVVAQGSAGADGKYRFRMPDKEIDKVLAMAAKIDAIVFIDIQAGLSTIQAEIPHFKKYLEMPNVHLGLDPEFAMTTSGKNPGKVIGTLSGTDINFAIEYLSNLVKEKNLPPKVLVVHRFTQGMLTNYKNIKPTPEVQVVIEMDGWGHQARKINTYKQFIYKEPVQFTGFKIFYKNDLKEENSVLLTPTELLKLNPRPIYIQYQ